LHAVASGLVSLQQLQRVAVARAGPPAARRRGLGRTRRGQRGHGHLRRPSPRGAAQEEAEALSRRRGRSITIIIITVGAQIKESIDIIFSRERNCCLVIKCPCLIEFCLNYQ